MSDAKLPAEGVTVLVWERGAKMPVFAMYASNPGVYWMAHCKVPTAIAPKNVERWVSLSDAKAAGRLAEALRAVASGDVPGVSIGPRQREWANEVLREIGT